MLNTRSLLLITLALIGAAWVSTSVNLAPHPDPQGNPSTTNNISASNKAFDKKLAEKATQAKAFVRDKKFNQQFCFLIDMSVASGQDRFIVYDLKKDSVLQTGLVTHGRCNKDFLEGRQYGNTVGCGCTSLGHYKIGNAYQGRFGLAYKLYGLDKTNDNAFKRFVVLHSHECVPEKEVEDEICQSDGCPTVAPNFLKKLASMLDGSKQSVLLWIYQ